jgi:hypothetical protein
LTKISEFKRFGRSKNSIPHFYGEQVISGGIVNATKNTQMRSFGGNDGKQL